NEEHMILHRIRRGEKVEHYETIRRRKDGSLVDISLTISPIRDRSGQVVGASKIARDITLRRRAQDALRESEERFRKLLEQRTAELRTSLGRLHDAQRLPAPGELPPGARHAIHTTM